MRHDAPYVYVQRASSYRRCHRAATGRPRREGSDHRPRVLNRRRPAMATVPGPLLLAISSPYARRGVLWDVHRRHYGQDGDVLVWQAPSRTMNRFGRPRPRG